MSSRRWNKDKIKFKFKINVYLILFFVVTGLIVYSIWHFVNKYREEQLLANYYNYKGYWIEFRKPIKNSYFVKVYPNESILNLSTLTLGLGMYKNLTLIIFEDDDNSYNAIAVAELIYKVYNVLNFELKRNYMDPIGINVTKIKDSLDNIQLDKSNYYIFLKSPMISNDTYIKVHSLNFVEISGKSMDEYDYAIIKFIITFLKNLESTYKS